MKSTKTNFNGITQGWERKNLAAIGLFVAGVIVQGQAWSLPTVPSGFSIKVVTSGLPIDNENALQDIAPGQGQSFGTLLYYIVNQNEIWRVNPLGGTPSLFATVIDPRPPKLTMLSFGFDGDLFAVDGNANPGRVFRIKSDGTAILFSDGVPTASEGIAYSAGGAFGKKLYLSEFDNNPNPISTINSAGDVAGFTTLNDSNRLTGLAFAHGGSFGTDLFGVDHSGTLYKVASNGTSSQFSVNPAIGRNETLAFGNAYTTFGENLFVTPDGKGNILKITPSGASSVFASGFAGFDYRGVTGLKFSQDNKTLFVTDDLAGTIYAISGQGAPGAAALWKFSVVASAGSDALSDPALDKAVDSGKWQIAFTKSEGPIPPSPLLPLDPTTFDTSVYLQEIGGALTAIAKPNDPTPQGQGYYFYGTLTHDAPVSLSQGAVTFNMRSKIPLNQPGSDPNPTIDGVYVGDGHTTHRVADTTMLMPESQLLFQRFGNASIDSGHVVFYGASDLDTSQLPRLEGIYGVFGGGFGVLPVPVVDSNDYYLNEGSFHNFLKSPSVSVSSNPGPDHLDVAFAARPLGVYSQVAFFDPTPGFSSPTKLTDRFPSNTSFSDPSVSSAGMAFYADLPNDSAATGIYISMDTFPVATKATAAPEGGTFTGFGIFPSIDYSPPLYWVGFVGDTDNKPAQGPGGDEGVYLVRRNRTTSSNDLYRVINKQGVLDLLESKFNLGLSELENIDAEFSLFHDAVKNGSVAFLFRINGLKDYIILAESCAMNLNAKVSVTRGGIRLNRATKRYVQQVTIKNEGDTGINGPVSLALDNLSINADWINKTDGCGQPVTPYVTLNLGADNALAPGESVPVVLEFINPTNRSITYDTRMLIMAP